MSSRRSFCLHTATGSTTFTEKMLKSWSFVTIALQLWNLVINFEKYYKKISCISHQPYWSKKYWNPLYQRNYQTKIYNNPRRHWYSLKRFSCNYPLPGIKKRGVWIWKWHRNWFVLASLIVFTLYRLLICRWTWHR